MAIVTFEIDCAMVALVPWFSTILAKHLLCGNCYRGVEPMKAGGDGVLRYGGHVFNERGNMTGLKGRVAGLVRSGFLRGAPIASGNDEAQKLLATLQLHVKNVAGLESTMPLT